MQHSNKSVKLDMLKFVNGISNIEFIHVDMEDDIVCVVKFLIEEYRPIITYKCHTNDNFLQMKSMLQECSYSQYIINEENSEYYINHASVLAIPNEKVPNDFLEMYNKNLNVLPDVFYCCIKLDEKFLYSQRLALTLTESEEYYKRDVNAKILVQITRTYEYNDVKILQQRGEPNCIVDCFRFVVERYSVNNKNLILI